MLYGLVVLCLFSLMTLPTFSTIPQERCVLSSSRVLIRETFRIGKVRTLQNQWSGEGYVSDRGNVSSRQENTWSRRSQPPGWVSIYDGNMGLGPAEAAD
jgi:hypothetical protein